VVNGERQIVLVNDKAEELLEQDQPELLGKRPGEAFNCVHSQDHAGGCGTSQFCRYCGAVQAILHSREEATPDVQDCRLSYLQGHDSPLPSRRL
jgi:hypothetical protein